MTTLSHEAQGLRILVSVSGTPCLFNPLTGEEHALHPTDKLNMSVAGWAEIEHDDGSKTPVKDLLKLKAGLHVGGALPRCRWCELVVHEPLAGGEVALSRDERRDEGCRGD